MTLAMSLSLCLFVLAVMAVASNPSPYFAALGLVVVAGLGCGILVSHGGPFLSLVLFLIYLGGMLVVFAYSAALAAEPYPETWGSWSVLGSMAAFAVAVVGGLAYSWGGWHQASWVGAEEGGGFLVGRGDMGGVAVMYASGGGLLVTGAGVLLLTLFVVLELTRGLSRGALRAV